MKVRRILLGLLLVGFALTDIASAAGSPSWADSVYVKALSSDETSLQDVLNSLGYSIDVTTDETGLSTFTTPAGLNRVILSLKHLGGSYASPVGWYPAADSSARTEILPVASTPGAASEFNSADGAEFGVYIGTTLFGDTWFTNSGLNWDSFDHARIFQGGDPNVFVIAWEDLPAGGDQDFQDMIVEVRFASESELSLDFDGQTFYLFCTEDYVCFDVNAAGGSGDLTLYLLEDGTPTEVASGPSPLSYEYCFLPWPVDSIHTFTFRVEDQGGGSVEDDFSIEIRMNSRPDLTILNDHVDTTICEIDSVCFDVVEATDADGDEIEFSLHEGEGSIDPVTGEICFLPDDVDSATYMFVVQASDSCCASHFQPLAPSGCERDTLWITVHLAPRTEITTIEDTTIFLCEITEVCFPVTATTGGVPTDVFQDCGVGTLANGELCFTPTGAGQYQFCFYATDDCGTVRDTVNVTIVLNLPPIADAGPDSLLHCNSGEVCWPASCSDPDDNLISCELIEGVGTYNGSSICFTAPGPGTYQFVLQATDECQAVDLDTVAITIEAGSPPTASVGDLNIALCELEQVCVPAGCSDPDDDLTSCGLVLAPTDAVYNGSTICFTPPSSGEYIMVLRAVDACGAEDYDTGTVVVDLNQPPQVNPGGGNYDLCEPGMICVPVNAYDPDGDYVVTTTAGAVVDNNTVCIYSGDQEGSRQIVFDVMATDTCGLADTAQYVINLRLNMPPEIVAPTLEADTVCKGTELCFQVTAIDSVMTDLVYSILTGVGIIDETTGEVCFSAATSGNYTWKVVVTDSCGLADTANVAWNIFTYPDPTPVIGPEDGESTLCLGDPVSEICVDFTYDDTQDITDITVQSSNNDIDWSSDFVDGVGQICFTPLADVDETYEFNIELTDICDNTASTTYRNSVTFIDCDSSDCLTLSIEQTECITLGSVVNVDITVSERLIPIGGYDLMIHYDASAFSVLSASKGSAVSGWEYFTFRLGPFANCGGSCPSGLVQLIAIADVNNGGNHPPVEQFEPDGVLGYISFRATSNSSFAGLVYPVQFYWWECGDNGISTVSGDTLLIDRYIYDPEYLIWDETDDVNFPEEERYFGTGVPDTCTEGDKTKPWRCVTFNNGSICIIHNDSIDKRGDINLNGVANEISDAVLFTNYFLRGIGVFTVSVAGQTAASDVNNDGLTLSIGDLIYLIRIITGDAMPIPKLSPYSEEAVLSIERTGGSTAVYSEAASDLGGVFLKIDLADAGAYEVIRALRGDDVEFEYDVDGNIMSLLIYSDEQGAKIPSGKAKLFDMRSDGDLRILHAEASDYYGNMISLRVEKAAIPLGFELGQNYPNPFNPETDIAMYLARPSSWTLSIFNISGQMVRQFAGSSPAGVVTVTWDGTDQQGRSVATGIYLYRLDAGDFSDTRKMLLLK